MRVGALGSCRKENQRDPSAKVPTPETQRKFTSFLQTSPVQHNCGPTHSPNGPSSGLCVQSIYFLHSPPILVPKIPL